MYDPSFLFGGWRRAKAARYSHRVAWNGIFHAAGPVTISGDMTAEKTVKIPAYFTQKPLLVEMHLLFTKWFSFFSFWLSFSKIKHSGENDFVVRQRLCLYTKTLYEQMAFMF